MLTQEGWDQLDRFFDASVEMTGNPPEHALFDPQLAEYLDTDWLIQRARIEEGLEPAQVEQLLTEKLVTKWPSKSGKQGFIPYSPRQIGVFQKLKATGRYELGELQHIAEHWGDYLEAVVIDEPPYDNRDGDELEHFRRRVQENLEFLREQSEPGGGPDGVARESFPNGGAVSERIAGKTQSDLPLSLKRAVQRSLWRLRWNEEFVRLLMAHQFEGQLLQGYGLEVSFYEMSWTGRDPTFGDVDWHGTFRRVRETRASGRKFPLRMPEFNVTERGLELIAKCTPDQYRTLYEKYHLEEMLQILEQMGKDLWSPPAPPLGDVVCAECNQPFWRDNSMKVYCTEKCRKRAKNRRWRESNPATSAPSAGEVLEQLWQRQLISRSEPPFGDVCRHCDRPAQVGLLCRRCYGVITGLAFFLAVIARQCWDATPARCRLRHPRRNCGASSPAGRSGSSVVDHAVPAMRRSIIRGRSGSGLRTAW